MKGASKGPPGRAVEGPRLDLIADSFYEELGQKLPKGSPGTIPFEVFVKNEAGDRFLIESQFFAVWYNDLLASKGRCARARA